MVNSTLDNPAKAKPSSTFAVIHNRAFSLRSHQSASSEFRAVGLTSNAGLEAYA